MNNPNYELHVVIDRIAGESFSVLPNSYDESGATRLSEARGAMQYYYDKV